MQAEAIVLDKAFELRRRHFPDEMHFHGPGIKRYETQEFQPRPPQQFVPISVTGRHCALDCDHCGKQILRYMGNVAYSNLFAFCERLADNGTQGLLVSGGCDAAGRVPLAPWLPALRRVRQELGLRLIVHTGLVDEPLAAGLAAAGVESARIDIIGADRTIRQVYHLGRGVEHYEESLRLLAAYGVSTLPHIIVGLHYGRLLGERNALAMIKRHAPAGLIVVVLTPLAQTRMADVVPPAVGPVLAFLAAARAELPTVPIFLGCARHSGEERLELDRGAIDAGLNGIAFPAEGAVGYAAQRGLTARFHESCCGVWPLAADAPRSRP
jgi:uncharacterized radical SAM superfamily protein